MGLFDFFTKDKPVVIPEPDKQEIEAFFTEEAKSKYNRAVRLDYDEMVNEWNSDCTKFGWYTSKVGNPSRVEYPCTIFADYLRALKTTDKYRLAVYAAVTAYEGEEKIPYPDCLKPERNPFINFAIKIKPLLYSKNGEDIQYMKVFDILIAYLFEAYKEGVDESNESWIYEKSLWFNANGKLKNNFEILSEIKVKTKLKDIINKYRI